MVVAFLVSSLIQGDKIWLWAMVGGEAVGL